MRRCAIAVAVAALSGCGHSSSQPQQAPQRNEPGPFRSLAIDVEVSPSRAGSMQNPQPARLDLRLRLGAPRAAEPPILKTADVRLPVGARYRGGALPACPQELLARRGPDACPPGSLVGRGTVDARADTARAPGRVTVVNGGAERLYFYTEIDRPVRAQAPIVGVIMPDRAPWAYRLRLTVPRELQIVAGVPIALRELHVMAGRGAWLSTTSCPKGGRWAFEGSAQFEGGGAAQRTTHVRCDE